MKLASQWKAGRARNITWLLPPKNLIFLILSSLCWKSLACLVLLSLLSRKWESMPIDAGRGEQPFFLFLVRFWTADSEAYSPGSFCSAYLHRKLLTELGEAGGKVKHRHFRGSQLSRHEHGWSKRHTDECVGSSETWGDWGQVVNSNWGDPRKVLIRRLDSDQATVFLKVGKEGLIPGTVGDTFCLFA